MLGTRIEFLIISILVFIPLIIPVFADGLIFDDYPIMVETDKSQYKVGESVIITGIIEEKKMPVIALRVFDPDGSILSANQLEIEDDNTFSKIISLEEPFYEKTGTYTITIDYGKLSTETSFEVENQIEDNHDIISSFDTEIEPEVIVVTDKEVYEDNDTITITGIVFSSQEPTVLVGIYDPFDNPAGFYLADVDSTYTFSVSFLVKSGVNFKTEGVYSVIARYGGAEDKITFEFVEELEIDESEVVPADSYKDFQEPLEQNEDDNIETDTTPLVNNEQSSNELNEQKNDNKIVQEEIKKDADSKIRNEQSDYKKNEVKKAIKSETQSLNNLSVDDIELGKLLNRINLSCDTSEFVDVISYYDGMGPALVRLCKYHDAISYYDKSLIDDPHNMETLNNKGSALGKLRLYAEAISYYNSALAIDPNYVPAIINKANALAALGYYDGAVLAYDQALLLLPDHTIAINNLEKTKDKLVSNKAENMGLGKSLAHKTENIETKTNLFRTPNILEQIGNTLSSLGNAIFGFLS